MSSDAAAKLESAREALALGDLKRTRDEAWGAAAEAARTGDEATLHSLIEIADAVERQLSGRARDEAERLRLYITYCLTDAQEGTRRGTPMERLFGLVGRLRKR